MYDLIKYNGSEFMLVDVRTPVEYAQGFIPTAFLVTVDNGKITKPTVPWNEADHVCDSNPDMVNFSTTQDRIKNVIMD